MCVGIRNDKFVNHLDGCMGAYAWSVSKAYRQKTSGANGLVDTKRVERIKQRNIL